MRANGKILSCIALHQLIGALMQAALLFDSYGVAQSLLCCHAVLCCQGDVEALTSMLQYSRDILSQVVDENRRR